MRRHTNLWALLGIAVLLVLMIVVLMAPGSAETEPAPADYNTEGRWPGSDPLVCVLDKTAGFPVHDAVTEFEGLPVTFVVEDDCAGYSNVVEVVTINDQGMPSAGWFRAERRPDDETVYVSAEIRVNLAEGYRMDPHGWRMVLVHELGHAAGLDHTWEADSVMDPLEYQRLDGLTETDRQQIVALYGP